MPLRPMPRVRVARQRTLVRIASTLVMCAAALAAHAALAPDDARESRWAGEVVPQLVVGEPVWLSTPQRARVLAIYTPASGTEKAAVVVVHGAGVHPDWSLIGELRSTLPEQGYATLAVQMPVLAADAPRSEYETLFPLAAQRLDAAVAWLRQHDHPRIAVLSHSLGAAMANAWIAASAPRPQAWIPIGMMVDFATPPKLPVLDIVAERDYPETLASARVRGRRLPHDKCSATVRIADTDHFLERAVPRAVERIVPFLDAAMAGKC
jgi:alpha-beta hydrolase superfamily lysophospholipase